MSSFDDREKGFEAKYRLDQETQFKVTARRNKLLGLWAAGKMGLTGDAAETYAREVVAAAFEKSGHANVIEKVLQDLTAHKITVSEDEIRKQSDLLAVTAREQILTENGKA